MSLGLSVNKNENGMLLAYIAENIPDIHLRKLLKIIYLIDEHFMKMRGFPLTWFDYYAWAKGPVAPEVYDIKNGAFSEFVSSRLSADDKRVVNPVLADEKIANGVIRAFSTSERAEINKLIERYKTLSADELSDITHLKDSLWSKAIVSHNLVFDSNNKKSDVRLDLRQLIADCDVRANAYDDAHWAMELQAKISSRRNPNHRIHLQVITSGEREQYLIPTYSPAIP